MDFAWNISSVIEIIMSTDESLMFTINSLPIAGKALRIACGKMTFNIACPFDKPRERAASICPGSTD